MFGMKVAKGHKLLDAKRIVFLVLSVATVSYDTVFDLLKSLVSGIKGKEEKGWSRL